MFKLFTKKKRSAAEQIDTIADRLFSQILSARDEARAGKILSEKIFNDRLNHMYVAGYLIGYVDRCIEELSDDDSRKKEMSRMIFEKMFPGSGFDFVRAKLMLRQQAHSLSPDDQAYPSAVKAAMYFDEGMDQASEEIAVWKKDDSFAPCRLREFLLLGETSQ